HLIDKRADQAQRMIRRNTPFDVNVTEELDRRLVNSAHRAPLNTCESIADNAPRESHPNRLENTLFQQPASACAVTYTLGEGQGVVTLDQPGRGAGGRG